MMNQANKNYRILIFLAMTLFVLLSVKVNAKAVIYVEGERENGYPTISGDDGWDYQLKANEAVVRGYTGSETVVTVPSYVDYGPKRYPVGAIGEYAFSPDNIKKTADKSKSFTGNKVVSITIPLTVDAIGNYAFYKNESIAVVNFANDSGMKAIGDYAFSNCTEITQLSIPNTVQTMGMYCFSGCNKLRTINIPTSMVEISSNCFEGCSVLASIQLHKGITKIDVSAFKECIGLNSINLHDGITEIGKSAFESCESMKEIHIPTGIRVIAEKTFTKCYSLTGVNVPKNVEKIGNNAFSYCRDLTTGNGTVKLNEGLIEIESRAFYDTPEMKSISIPYSVTTIGSTAIGYYLSEAGTRVVPGFTIYGYFDTKAQEYNDENNFHFEGKVKKGAIIESGEAEYMTTARYEVKLSNITQTNLTTFTVPKTITKGKVTYKVTAVGDKAFKDCKVLKTATVAENVTSIGKNAFANCKALEEVTIGKKVKTIDKNAFLKCSKLAKITIKSTALKTVGKDAFKKINKKATIKVPKSKLSKYKKLLKKGTLPKKVTITK